jgi:AraC family transcriptional regulator
MSKGVSLRRYVNQLRLARALIELRSVDDLTRLALELGFSSHSHFTLAFRRAFGCTPSQFRGRNARRHRRGERGAGGAPPARGHALDRA